MELIVKWLVPFLCGSAVSALVTYCTVFRALRDGVQCLLRAELIRTYQEYAYQGGAAGEAHCPMAVKEAVRRAYAAYHRLGGNDVVTELYHKILKMPEEDGEFT